MRKILWYFKQLVPMTYRSRYEVNGNKVFHVWKMWFGKCYKQDKYIIVE
jgi:hypothetical protein